MTDFSKQLGSITDYERFFDALRKEVEAGQATPEYIVHWLDFVKSCIAEERMQG